MSTILPKDINDTSIPALRLKQDGAHNIAISTTSARNTVVFDPDTRVISLYATVPTYLAFGDSSVTATSANHYFPAGLYYDVSIGGDDVAHYSHVAVIRADAEDGVIYISEKE